MEILVNGTTVETKDIYSITDVENGKTNFRNREAGFIINRIDLPPLIFKEDMPYERTPNDIHEVKSKWDTLRDKVFEKWQSGKSEIESFSL